MARHGVSLRHRSLKEKPAHKGRFKKYY